MQELGKDDNIKLADFFCGVGGIRLGFEQASNSLGHSITCVFSNDIDKNAIKTYQANFKDIVNSKSITDIETKDVPNFDILLAGFPCVDFSIAGSQKGFNGDKGVLFFEVVRMLKEKQPKAFLLENVKNIKTHNKGETYKTVKRHLKNAGYFFKCKVMNSLTYGNVPQNRERIFIVGFKDIEKAKKFKFPSKLCFSKPLKSVIKDDRKPEKYYYTEASFIHNTLLESIQAEPLETVYQYRRTYVRENKNGVCFTLTANMGTGGHNVPIVKDSFGIRKLTPRECFDLQAFPKNFFLPSISDSYLYKQSGNSVSVSLIKRIAKNILQVL
jgi:DNA (cytosine-5)-methyltransferase 1